METLVRLRSIDASVRAIVIRGYSDDPGMANCDPFGFASAVAKPFTPAYSEAAVRRVARAT